MKKVKSQCVVERQEMPWLAIKGSSLCPKGSLFGKFHFWRGPAQLEKESPGVIYEEDRERRCLAQETRPKSYENIPERPGVGCRNWSHSEQFPLILPGTEGTLTRGGQNLQRGLLPEEK